MEENFFDNLTKKEDELITNEFFKVLNYVIKDKNKQLLIIKDLENFKFFLDDSYLKHKYKIIDDVLDNKIIGHKDIIKENNLDQDFFNKMYENNLEIFIFNIQQILNRHELSKDMLYKIFFDDEFKELKNNLEVFPIVIDLFIKKQKLSDEILNKLLFENTKYNFSINDILIYQDLSEKMLDKLIFNSDYVNTLSFPVLIEGQKLSEEFIYKFIDKYKNIINIESFIKNQKLSEKILEDLIFKNRFDLKISKIYLDNILIYQDISDNFIEKILDNVNYKNIISINNLILKNNISEKLSDKILKNRNIFSEELNETYFFFNKNISEEFIKKNFKLNDENLKFLIDNRKLSEDFIKEILFNDDFKDKEKLNNMFPYQELSEELIENIFFDKKYSLFLENINLIWICSKQKISKRVYEHILKHYKNFDPDNFILKNKNVDNELKNFIAENLINKDFDSNILNSYVLENLSLKFIFNNKYKIKKRINFDDIKILVSRLTEYNSRIKIKKIRRKKLRTGIAIKKISYIEKDFIF